MVRVDQSLKMTKIASGRKGIHAILTTTKAGSPLLSDLICRLPGMWKDQDLRTGQRGWRCRLTASASVGITFVAPSNLGFTQDRQTGNRTGGQPC